MATKNFDLPQLTPVFSFKTQKGDEINIYAARTEYTTALLITLVSDELIEYTWAVTAGDYPVAFRELVEKARDTYSRTVPSSKNPFDELLNDVSAMCKLENIISKL